MPLRLRRRAGLELVMVIVIMGMISAIGLAVLQMVSDQNRLSNREIRQQQTFQIAEAGVNYYRWRLAHYPNDYQDGTNTAGPYVHDYVDGTGTTVGRYELTITPPVTGSTIATIVSSGYLLSNPNARRTITVKLGIPSLSKYAVVANADMRFGAGTETFGPVHSNGGIHFDGIAHGLVSSAQTTYTDPDSGLVKPGVWSQNNEATTFLGGKQVGVTTINFNGITVDLAALKDLANSSGGLLLPASGAQGYHVTFRTDDKVDIRKVVGQMRCQYNNSGSWADFGFCSNDYNTRCSQDSTCGSGNTCTFSSFSIGTRTADQVVYQLGVPLPSNGIIFVPEDTWVDGTIDTARVTLVAAADPITTGNANIYVNNDLKYTHTDGQDVIGLIAQNNILTGYFSEDDIRIDAALIAQKGRVGRPYYGAGFTTSNNNTNFRLYPDTGICTANIGKSCAVNGDCTNFCQSTPTKSCTTNANCSNFCLNNTSRSCSANGDCNNFCQNDATKSCSTSANCTNYCSGDHSRSCTSDTKCNGWCTGNHNKGCSNNGDCTGFGSCDSSAPNVGPCTSNAGACVTTDSCVTAADTCFTSSDTCSLTKNPAGGTTCQEYRKRSSLTAYGSLATNQRYGFAWVWGGSAGSSPFQCGGGLENNSGYCIRNLNFDSNLTFAPPPSFPTSGEYSIISYIEQ